MTYATNNDGTHRDWMARPVTRAGMLLGGAILISALGGWTRRARASADPVIPTQAIARSFGAVERELEDARGQLAVQQLTIDRLETIVRLSQRYQIPADLSAAIHDIALSEGIDPALGHELVKVESEFKAKAMSGRGAIGYTQLQLKTARFYEPAIRQEQLFDRDVNLRIGFRFLRDLIKQYNGSVELALVAYNRGPGTVNGILAEGGDPQNGYAQQVLEGMKARRRG